MRKRFQGELESDNINFMEGFSPGQRKILSDFLTNIAVGWFAAGVISTVFVRSAGIIDSILNVLLGVVLAYTTVSFALYLESSKK